MTTIMQTTATKRVPSGSKRVPMTALRKTALVAGIFYLITFISIPTLALYGPVTNHRNWILGSGSHTGLLVGGLLEVIVARLRRKIGHEMIETVRGRGYRLTPGNP